MDIAQELRRKSANDVWGRDQELALLNRLLTHTGIKLVHVSGPGGIGKSALIRHFCLEHYANDAFMLRLNGSDDAPSVRVLPLQHGVSGMSDTFAQNVPLDQLGEFLNAAAFNRSMTLCIIDPFEPWLRHFDWITGELIGCLPPHVRILSASRFPLEDSWPSTADGVQTVRNMELKPLDQTNRFTYIESLGIHDFDLIHKISKFSRGFPFAIQQISRDALTGAVHVPHSPRYKMNFYQKAVRYMLQDHKLTNTQAKLLDAASTLWSFDYDLITQLLQYEVTIQAFRTFCDLPFVRLTSEGWQIQSAVRHWFRKEFSFRSPELHQAYQHRARSCLLKRLHQRPQAERFELYLQLLHLIDNDFLHTYCFHESFDEFDIQPISKQDLPAVRQMFITFHHKVPGFFPDLTQQESLLERYWDLSPDTFYGFYKHNRLELFVSSLPLTMKIRRELVKNPTYSNYIARSAYQDNEVVMWIAAFTPEFGASAVGLSFMYGYSRIAPHSLMTVITPFPEAHQLMESMGFQRLAWGDYVSPDGMEYKAYQLDLRSGLLTERFLASRGSAHGSTVPSRIEMIEHTKKLLSHFHHFEENEAFVSSCPLLRKYVHSKQELAEAANQLRKLMLSIVEEWCSGTGLNVIYGDILRLCYIQKAGGHETVALRLNMSLSTYYRNLKKAASKMSDALSEFYPKQGE